MTELPLLMCVAKLHCKTKSFIRSFLMPHTQGHTTYFWVTAVELMLRVASPWARWCSSPPRIVSCFLHLVLWFSLWKGREACYAPKLPPCAVPARRGE